MKKDGQFESYEEVTKFIPKLSHRKAKITELYAERMKYLLSQLGKPEDKLKVVHITGTSGKGSVAALIASITHASGYRTGLQMSPHLQSVRERTQVDGKFPKTSTYLALANRVKKAFDKTVAKGSYGTPDYYQFLTAISLCWFVKRKVNVAVIEVGAGGYGDSTNVVIPTVSVITNVGLDHMGFMGKTIEEIAYVKAGIIKPGTSVVCGATQPSIISIFEKRAKQLGCKFSSVKDLVRYKIKKITPDDVIADIFTPTYKGENIKIGLTGEHQVRNASIAIVATKVLGRKYGFSQISNEAITEGLKKVNVPGRFEILQHNPMIVLDGAHNKDKMAALVKLIKKVFDKKKIYLLMGFKHNKDVKGMFESINELNIEQIVLTEMPEGSHAPRFMTAKKAKIKMGEKLAEITKSKASPKEAVDYLLEKVPEDGVIIVTGSLYLVGEIRNHWEEIE